MSRSQVKAKVIIQRVQCHLIRDMSYSVAGSEFHLRWFHFRVLYYFHRISKSQEYKVIEMVYVLDIQLCVLILVPHVLVDSVDIIIVVMNSSSSNNSHCFDKFFLLMNLTSNV